MDDGGEKAVVDGGDEGECEMGRNTWWQRLWTAEDVGGLVVMTKRGRSVSEREKRLQDRPVLS
jgi:hypothetical protein